MLAKSTAELQQSDFAGAQASAEVAKRNADKATEISKPLYEQAEQTTQNKARDEALARDASGINGTDVRLERRGDLQRLVIAVPELFSKRKPEIAAGHDGVIDALAELIKKYPTYPVQSSATRTTVAKPLNCWRFLRRARSPSTPRWRRRGSKRDG